MGHDDETAEAKAGIVDRRSFVKGAVIAGTGPLSTVSGAAGGEQVAVSAPSVAVAGADFMVDVLRSLRIPYAAANPASSFRGLHESLLNYGNAGPEFLTCMHEESSVAIAHGYAKAAGEPLVILAHSTVGLQHAAMAIYNAWCDRVPVIVIIGNIRDATMRRPGIEWSHTAQDPVSIVRDFVKWDDQPASLPHFAESLVRAYKIAMTPPMGPVVVVADCELQEMALKDAQGPLHVPKLNIVVPPQGDSSALREAAKLLVAAENPVIVTDRLARTAQGMAHLVQLAELLGAAVVDQGGRMNFPTNHPLSQNERSGPLLRGADLLLALEVGDRWGMVNEYTDNEERTITPRSRAKVISIGSADLYLKSNFQDFQRYAEALLSIGADGEASLPALIEFVRAAMGEDGRRRALARTETLRAAKAKAKEATLTAAAVAWDASPISTARLCAEIWEVIKAEDWAMVSDDRWVSNWPRRLWPFDRHDRFIGNSGGYGVGYGFPAAVGAALAYRAKNRFVVNIQSDGDLLYAPGALWTAVHHQIPLLTVMHNNRAYHQEMMHVQRMANRHNRGVDRAHIGTTIRDPFVSFSKLAESMGMWAEGPVSDPRQLGAALRRAAKIVKGGAPALVDVLTQPR